MELSADVLKGLEAMGRSGVARAPECLGDEDAAWRVLVNAPWVHIAESRTPEQVADLIRGLVLYSRATWRGKGLGLGGSVSPVIALYREVAKHNPPWESDLAKWIVKHRVNPYEPFGSSRDHGALTLAEFRERSRRYVEANHAAQIEREASEKASKAERKGKTATERLANAVRRGDLSAVQAMLAKGGDPAAALPDGGSLVAHAEASGREKMAEFLRSKGIA